MYVAVYCPTCDDVMPCDHVKGKWKCENCGRDLTKEAKRQIERELEFEKKNRR